MLESAQSMQAGIKELKICDFQIIILHVDQ